MAPKKFNSTTETLDRLAASGQLSALMRKNTPLPPVQREMQLEDIVPDPEQPRRHFDGEQLASLSASIKAQGVLQAITVQPSDEDGKHRIIMGERRFQAAQRAGLKTIPVVIREMTAELRMAQLTENVQRADLTTLEVAEAVAAMRAAGQSRSAIAQSLGWNEGEVSRFAALATMPAVLKEAAAGNAPIRALSDLHALWKKDEEAVSAFLMETSAGDISRVSVERLRAEIDTKEIRAEEQPTAQSPAGRKAEVPEGVTPMPGDPSGVVGMAAQSGPSLSGTVRPAPNAMPPQKVVQSAATLRIEHDGRMGTMHIERATSSNASVIVRLDGGHEEELPLSDIKLVEVRRN